MSERVEGPPTTPGTYFLLMRDQGGYETWRWFVVYPYPDEGAPRLTRGADASTYPLYVSQITSGTTMKHVRLDAIWSIVAHKPAPTLDSIIAGASDV